MIGLKMEKKKINDYLDELYLNPKCELNYTKDYELLIAVVLSAQTTDKKVNAVTKELFSKYPDLKALKNASIEDIRSIIYILGTYNRKAQYVIEIARILDEEYNGIVPNNRNLLESMPGVGRKVANVFLSEWYKEDNIAVDTHVKRVSRRLGIATNKDTVLEIENKLKKFFSKELWSKRHLQLMLFGRYKCKSIKPDCSSCKLNNICRYEKKK